MISTKGSTGAIHSSIVVCGVYEGDVAFVSVYPRSQKVRNLRRNSNCTVLAISEDWQSYAVIEGKATLFDYSSSGSEQMRIMLRDIYRVCSDTPHPNWEEYDKAMVEQGAVIVLVRPEKVYGVVG